MFVKILQGAFLFIIVFQGCLVPVQAQSDHGFPFGDVTRDELMMKTYDRDTTAEAVYINEFGDAFIKDSDDHALVFEYHARIKILRPGGLRMADFAIPLRKFNLRQEQLALVRASTFSLVNGEIKETKLLSKNVYVETYSKGLDLVKFAVPNVQVGSVIEVLYQLESPNVFNFRNWIFQNDVPKIRSGYWATIPGNYVYNITLRGFLDLASEEHEVVFDCFRPAGQTADCARHKFVMTNIPAFVEEEYMTAPGNFIAAINFELSEIKYFDGHTDKITKEWRDVEDELKRDERFGLQLRRGGDIVREKIDAVILGESDALTKATKIYEFIQSWYRWNEANGKYSELGIKKAFDLRSGNAGDINLSLIAAIKYAGLDVEPLILSTRDNGMPVDLHPVLSDFNYVVAKVNIQDHIYLLDATDKFLPFGVLPMRCLNGKGRALGEKGSAWYEIVPIEKKKRIMSLDLALQPDGKFTGVIKTVYAGYEAIQKRKEIHTFTNVDDYQKDLVKDLEGITINKVSIDNVDDLSKPLVENMDVSIQAFDGLEARSFFFNPFFIEHWEKNPFRSVERLYPVDFGAPIEDIMVISLKLPKGISVEDIPEKVALLLPNGGGKYTFGIQQFTDRIIINHALHLSLAVYTKGEYHMLKELFNRIIQVQNIDLVLKRAN